MATQSIKDSGDLVGHQPAASQDHCYRHVPLLSTVVTVVDSARDLGVIIDSQCLDAHFAALCRCGYYQLRQLRPVIRSLSAKATETLVHAFVSSRLDYCNSLLMASPTGYTVAFSPSRTQPRDLCVVSGVHIFFIHRDVCHISN